MPSTDTYTIKRIDKTNITELDWAFLRWSARHVNDMYGNKYSYQKFDILRFATLNYLTICYRNETPVGFMAASLVKSFFDPNYILLVQNLLFSLPKTRGTKLLLKDFIDFGKTNANHVITMIGEKTNIKPRSLEKLGFKKLEEQFGMEIQHG